MGRRLLALFVLLCLTVSLAVPAGAAEYTGFSDVDGSSSYAEAIQWAAEQGYISGYPDDSAARADFSSGYSYTRLGRADDPSGLAAALGRGSAEVSIRII